MSALHSWTSRTREQVSECASLRRLSWHPFHGGPRGNLLEFPQQDAEKVRQQRSRIVQTLNVPQRIRLGPSLAEALLDSLFEHPVGVLPCVSHVWTIESSACTN